MKFTILGCSGPFAGVGAACSSYLLSAEGSNILLDMGNGALAELQRVLPIQRVHAVVLSHLHHDHISDLHIFKYAVQQLLARKEMDIPPKLFLPATPKNVFDLITGDSILEAKCIGDGQQLQIGPLRLVFHAMTHPVESYAIEVFEGAKKLVYSGDTTWNPVIAGLAKDADLFLVDGGLLDRHLSPTAPHLSVRQACEIGALAKKTVVTHLSPFYEQSEVLSEMSYGAVLAQQGQTYIL